MPNLFYYVIAVKLSSFYYVGMKSTQNESEQIVLILDSAGWLLQCNYECSNIELK